MNKIRTFSGIFCVLLTASLLSAATLPSTVTVTQDGSTTVYASSGSGTISGDALTVSGTAIFHHAAGGNITITAPITGSGTIRHTVGLNHFDTKLALKGDLSGFSGTISQEGHRWIEIFTSDTTTKLDGSLAYFDMKNIVLSGTEGQYGYQGFAPVAIHSAAEKVVFQIGDLTSSAHCEFMSSGMSTKPMILQVGYLNNDSTFAGRIYHKDWDTQAPTYFVSIEKVGTGTWTLTGNSAYLGDTTITGGALQIGNGGTSGAINSPVINLGKDGTLIINRSGNVNWDTRRVNFETAQTPWTERIFDPATDSRYITSNIVKKGAGTWSITFPDTQKKEALFNSYSSADQTGNYVTINSNIEIQEGTLALTNAINNDIAVLGELTGTGTLKHATQSWVKLALLGDNREFAGTYQIDSNRWLELYGTEASSPDAVYTLTNSSQGIALVSKGDENFYFGALAGGGQIFRSDWASGNPTLVVGNENQLIPEDQNVFSGRFTANGNSKISIRKTGADTWTYAGTSGHAGDTTVDGGQLRLTGNLSKSDVFVEEDGELCFTGTIGSESTAADLTIDGGLVIDLTDGLNEDGQVFGNVTFGEEAFITVLMEDLTINEVWDASYQLKAGQFQLEDGMNFGELLSNGGSDIWQYSLDGGLLTISMNHSAVPEPSTWAMMVLGVLGILAVRARKTAAITAAALLLALFPALVSAQTPENGVCAHRGASIECPENSLEAFQRAIDIGADWIETDVLPTADGKLVLCHNRTTGAYASQDLDITRTTYADLCRLDMAEKFRARNGLTLEQCPPLKIVLLEEALELILKNKKARLTLHMKGNALEGIVKIVKEMGAEEWIGFNGHESLLIPAKKEFPNAKMFWDRYGSDAEADITLGKKHGFDSMIFFFKDVTPEKAAKVRAAGFEVGAWTVNGETDMKVLLDAGVTRFYTDDPRLLLKVMGERK